MSQSTTIDAVAARPPIWRDAVVLKWLAQVVLLVAVVGALVFLAVQAGSNLEARDIPTSFDFVEDPVGFQVSEGIDIRPATGGRALWVGMVNTFRIAIAGIFFATILGVIVGLARLSNNWIVKRIAGFYVETLRNIPLLVIIILLFAVIGEGLTDLALDEGETVRKGWFFTSNKGISVPRLFGLNGSWQWAAFMMVGAIVAWLINRNRSAVRDATGRETYPGLLALGTMVVFGIVGWFAHPVMGFLGPLWGAIADILESIPEAAVQIALSVAAVSAAAFWVRRFLASKSSGGGRAKLTDDDYFRMIFAFVMAFAAAYVFLILWPGFSSWLLNSGNDLFTLMESRFGSGNGGRPFGTARPEIIKPGNFANFGPSGLTMSIGFASVFIGVVLYTGAFIAEIVRGGIMAVAKGQVEAASAVGLSRMQSLRHVILPQAFRVILPPLGNQYLNLTKNTSLAVAVGYADIVQVGQTIYNQTGQTLPVVAIWMLFYLACSLTISVIVNWFNVRLKIVER